MTSQMAVPGISRNSVSDSPRKRLRTPSFFTASRMTLNEVDLRVDFEDCSICSRHCQKESVLGVGTSATPPE